MKLSPTLAIADLEKYVNSQGFRLSVSSKKIFLRAEELACEGNVLPFSSHFLVSLLENSSELQRVIIEMGGYLGEAIEIVQADFPDANWGPYDDVTWLYSVLSQRDTNIRTQLIDLSLAIARKHLRSEVFDTDIIEALFEAHNESYPIFENDEWKDERLHLPYQTLMHMVGNYEPRLNFEFSEIFKRLNLPATLKSPVEIAPASIRHSVLKLLQDYPTYSSNCFVIMSFASTCSHDMIFESIKSTLKKHNINALRADLRDYADELAKNIETYIYGCSFAVAVFERVEGETFNPNVSLEVGYMYGLGKAVCLLKERTMRQLPTDIIGKLYISFDIQNIEGTLPNSFEKWLRDNKII